ncbi:integrase [Kitasatospora sp. MAP12-15]|uniref:LacI family DNA-binding transcriptional regulator n=1 Tax=unclassified Kitasatospora TaxID=2633591 RepID=UPI00247634EB|nr:LacI family DNA-binding transcriptional regulator [Kitasatospora sp. MAP12-44]MDH6111528.1 integrase [Kitasatospora sp. MAP12-44]
MGYGEKRGDYYRARYRLESGDLATVVDRNGATIRFRTKREAVKAANDREAQLRAGVVVKPRPNPEPEVEPEAKSRTFGEYASSWYEGQDLAASTMQNYRRHIEEHLLPEFESVAIADLTRAEVEAWAKKERERGYAVSSIKTWRSTLHLVLGDAVEDGLRDANPAARRRGRGRRAGRSRNRGPEKVVTGALGILLIAERTALLSGRDDEFVAVVTKGFTGKRWGELVGLETEFVRPREVRVEWQLYELDSGELHRCPPKDDSYRSIDSPPFLSSLLAGHIARTKPKPCECHGLTYVFSGHGAANGSVSRPGAKLVDVARRAGVSTGTVSNVLNRPDAVAEATRVRVVQAIADLGYVRNVASGERAAHWRRSGFGTWLFQPAATGWYPKRGEHEAHPVPLVSEPWPGVPARGRGASQRAEASWLPIARGLTPHGLRHAHKTILDELKTPVKLKDERMGHEDGSVQARYSHITAEMRQELIEGLTRVWETALEARRRMSPGSPVAVLDALLRAGQ